jgi:LAO/AO transport system kinase
MSHHHSTSPRPRPELTVDDYFNGVRAGDRAILARALTLVESNSPRHVPVAEALLARLLPFTGHSIRVGITGVPGVGKSTFIESLGLNLVGQGQSVAVLAVDPSSRVSGGSILGDKTRMTRLATVEHAYIRPSPAAQTLGGVARKTRESLLICEAAGFDVVLVETVGVGQSETVVADMTDCFVALMLPGAGDELQGIKRGLLEVVDVLAVNKADGERRLAAELAAQQYRVALHSLAGRSYAPTVLLCSALEHTGITEVWQAIASHHQRLSASGELSSKRKEQRFHSLNMQLDEQLRRLFEQHPAIQRFRPEIESQVRSGTLLASTAARRLLEIFVRSEFHCNPSQADDLPEG